MGPGGGKSARTEIFEGLSLDLRWVVLTEIERFYHRNSETLEVLKENKRKW